MKKTDNKKPLASPTFPITSITNTFNENVIYLDGNTLTSSTLCKLADGTYQIALAEKTRELVKKSRNVVDELLESKKTVYGINTGFGKFATVKIPPDSLDALQLNLIRSHAAGVGRPLSLERVRMLFALRINVLAKGFSGITVETLEKAIKAFNCSCLPVVPEKGTVGASGDLAPLSHIVMGLLGEGEMWSPKTGYNNANVVLKENGLEPITLKPKEGLALINGTQFITALGAESIERSIKLALQADIIAALTIEVLKGNHNAFDADIHEARPHNGQKEVANRLRSLLNSQLPSQLHDAFESGRKVQDSYTLRCIPQVHGCVIDCINFAKNIIHTEMNSATDNPMVFRERNILLSGGNFHGNYPAKALDILAIGIQDLANISERRIERLVNNSLSEGLPAFLVADQGLNSGFMIAHCTAAALTSENKVLCHPSSIDTLSTSAATEDHVSMGGWSARKCLEVVSNVEYVLAIELLANCQALEFFHSVGLKTSEPLEAVYRLVRRHVEPWNKDRYMSPDIEAAVKLIQNNEIWTAAIEHIEKYNDDNDKFPFSVLL